MTDSGANGHHPSTGDNAGELDVASILDGKRILLIGTTGFVGKVLLSMLLRRYPNVGRVYCLVRPGAGNTADERFFRKVASARPFDPVREVWQGGYDAFMHEKIVPIPGDIGRSLCNFDDAQFEMFERDGGLDVVVNSAGLVSFTPSLESALRINALGAKNVLETARRAKAKLVHISTCYVAGRRDGEVWEDEEVVGYFPRRDELLDADFSPVAEIEDCQRILEQVRERSNDRQHISEFREKAYASLKEQRRNPDDEGVLRLAVARERKIWVHERLTKLGMERAAHWGWTNTYTYTKSLGEQLILMDEEVTSSIVRPAVVESSVRYPFPGWNEGFNTTAPLVYLVKKGHRSIVSRDVPMDIIPVDFIAAGTIMATAAILANVQEKVYQLGSSAVNPVSARRLTELTGLAVRLDRRAMADAGEDKLQNRVRARLEAMSVDYDHYQKYSAPLFRRLAKGASRLIEDKVPTWGAPRLQAFAERAQDKLGEVINFTDQVDALVELFKPFNYDHDLAFRSDNIRRLHQRLTPADQAALPWDPEAIDWRHYWIETHYKGLKEHVFPVLDDEFGVKPRSVYTYKDLLELFDAAARLHRHRVAMRLLPTEDEDAPTKVYTYGRIQDMALQGAGWLRQLGVETKDRVMLLSENRPEWGISYFAILHASACVVPVDAQLTPAEVENLLRASGAKVFILSDKQADRLCEEGGLTVIDDDARGAVARWLRERGLELVLIGFERLFSKPDVSPGALVPAIKGDHVASIIFTSGTTGQPKGVMLTHKNFTAMASKLSSLFKLYPHDGLLSVLPLHHTFEFSAGFLMPLLHGSSINYLEEVGADGLNVAFDSGHITGMVGVPALWQLLHRKIVKAFKDRGPLVLRGFESVIDFNRGLRDKAPLGVGLGKVLFYPIHRKLGGRMRLLISGGSALSPEVMKDFRGLGFQLYEGYGMTESSPVLTVTRPDDGFIAGSVGRALPGIDVRIYEPDERGVGEVIAKGPNVMLGYYENEAATAQVLRDGWLHTGDLGRMDEEGNLFIVGRKKEMILGASGENVYPDELEELYNDSSYIKELSVVGLPSKGGQGETVAALVVPEYEQDDLDRETVRERVREHMRNISKSLPLYKRVKVFHLWDHDLPKTSTRKVKRREVVVELERLERATAKSSELRALPAVGDASESRDVAWVRDVVASVSQKPRAQVVAEARLQELGFDSLMFTELGVALEAAGLALPDPSEVLGFETVADLEAYVARLGGLKAKASLKPRAAAKPSEVHGEADEIRVPKPLVRIGRAALGRAQRAVYETVFTTKVHGKAYVPPFGGYIVAANHASHLDMGLVKHSLGEQGEALTALAAKDYFFEDPVRRMYFENFTNLVPMERHGSLRESLRLANEVIRAGYILLIFPEGTRSESGVMIDFKPSLGYLALTNKCGILPMYLAGTHDALPKGAWVPKEKEIAAHIGPFLSYERLAAMSQGKSRSESYRSISNHVEGMIRKMAPEAYEWTLGEAGRLPVADYLAAQAHDSADEREAEPAPAGVSSAEEARHVDSTELQP